MDEEVRVGYEVEEDVVEEEFKKEVVEKEVDEVVEEEVVEEVHVGYELEEDVVEVKKEVVDEVEQEVEEEVDKVRTVHTNIRIITANHLSVGNLITNTVGRFIWIYGHVHNIRSCARVDRLLFIYIYIVIGFICNYIQDK